MTAVVLALCSTNVETENSKLLAIFCGAGLLASILLAIYGPAADLTSGFC